MKKTKQVHPSISKAFLIRCWQQEGEEWRFMLEDVSTRERKYFVDVAEMAVWVTAVLDQITAEKNEV